VGAPTQVGISVAGYYSRKVVGATMILVGATGFQSVRSRNLLVRSCRLSVNLTLSVGTIQDPADNKKGSGRNPDPRTSLAAIARPPCWFLSRPHRLSSPAHQLDSRSHQRYSNGTRLTPTDTRSCSRRQRRLAETGRRVFAVIWPGATRDCRCSVPTPDPHTSSNSCSTSGCTSDHWMAGTRPGPSSRPHRSQRAPRDPY